MQIGTNPFINAEVREVQVAPGIKQGNTVHPARDREEEPEMAIPEKDLRRPGWTKG